MSEENVELFRQIGYAWNRGDLEWILAHVSTDFEWHPNPGIPGVKPLYRGREGFSEFWSLWRDAWESTTFRLGRIEDFEEQVVVSVTQTTRGRGSGVDVSDHRVHLWTFRDGLAVRARSFSGWEEALEAAGIEE